MSILSTVISPVSIKKILCQKRFPFVSTKYYLESIAAVKRYRGALAG